MIKSIKTYFEDMLNKNAEDNSAKTHTIELATAVLMIEISLANDHIHEDERRIIKNLLINNFGIDENEIDELISLAEKELDHAVSLYEFTRLVNDMLNTAEKINVVENLWRVAYADSVIDKYEEYYIRKVANLLYVSHSNYIKAKLNAKEQL